METSGGAYHPREKLEEVGVEPAQEELTEANLSEEEVEQHICHETLELESTTEWQASATRYGENNRVGDQVDIPLDQHEEMQQQRRLPRS